MNGKTKLGLALMALFVLFTMVAAAPAPAFAAVEGCKQSHTVVAGEYLSKIAGLYGKTWSELATLNQLKDPNLIFVGQVLCISTSGTTGGPTPTPTAPTSSTVRVYAASAVEDKAVTIKGKQLDVSSTYTIYLSNYKLTGGIETLVGTAKTGADGTLSATFSLPRSLVDVALIRITAVNSRGDRASNWFINTTGSGAIGGLGSPAISLTIDEVKEGDWVKITASNLPANVTFRVYIAKGDSTGEVLVGHMRSSTGGKVTATFDLPSEYVDRTKLEVQVENEWVQMEAIRDFDND